jgi:hypothetical protein
VLRFAADENFNGDVVRGLRQRLPDLDIVRIQDTDLAGADDPTVLAWAAAEDRIVLTHDETTMTRFAYERVAAGLAMRGVVEVRRSVPTGQAIEEIALIAQCSFEGEHHGRVEYLPL